MARQSEVSDQNGQSSHQDLVWNADQAYWHFDLSDHYYKVVDSQNLGYRVDQSWKSGAD